MADANQVAKNALRTTLGVTIAATTLAKYGLNASTGLVKVFLSGAEKLANQMVGNGIKIGIGTYLMEKTEKAVNWGFDKLIAGQKNIKGNLK